jgi:hypothetical protein
LQLMGPEPTAHLRSSLGDDSQTVAGSLPASVPAASPQKSRRWWRRSLALAAAGLILAALGFSKIGGEWSRLSRSIDFLRITKPASASSIQPAAESSNAQVGSTAIGFSGLEGSNPAPSTSANNSPQIPVPRPRAESGTASPRQDPSAQMIRQISLEVPPDLKTMIREQVLINVSVDIDQRGRVSAAEVASTKGKEATLLTTEALNAARRFRFRPNRRGNKAVMSQTVLTFVFDPQAEDLPEGPPFGN